MYDVDISLDVESRGIDSSAPHCETGERVLLVADFRLLEIVARAGPRIYVDAAEESIVQQLLHVESTDDMRGKRPVLRLLGDEDAQPD